MEFVIELIRIRESDGAIAVLDRIQFRSDDFQHVTPEAKRLFFAAWDLVQKPDALRVLDERGYELLFWKPSDERATTIYMPLMKEGTEVWRPVRAERISDEETYLVLEAPWIGEDWAFAIGAEVRCEPRTFSDGTKGFVAVELAKRT